MKRFIFFTALVIFNWVACIAQEGITETKELKGWTKEARILYADFKGKPTQRTIKLNKELGLQASAQVAFRSILDVPRRKKDRGKLMEKVYVAPFFIKTGSVTFTKDEKELDKQRIYFDMAEVVARRMRMYVEHINDSVKSYGAIWLIYASIKDKHCAEYGKMFNDYTIDVFGEKNEGAYERWRKLIDEMLAETEKYATTKEDCARFVTELPVDEAYEQSETVVSMGMRCQ